MTEETKLNKLCEQSHKKYNFNLNERINFTEVDLLPICNSSLLIHRQTNQDRLLDDSNE